MIQSLPITIYVDEIWPDRSRGKVISAMSVHFNRESFLQLIEFKLWKKLPDNDKRVVFSAGNYIFILISGFFGRPEMIFFDPTKHGAKNQFLTRRQSDLDKAIMTEAIADIESNYEALSKEVILVVGHAQRRSP